MFGVNAVRLALLLQERAPFAGIFLEDSAGVQAFDRRGLLGVLWRAAFAFPAMRRVLGALTLAFARRRPAAFAVVRA